MIPPAPLKASRTGTVARVAVGVLTLFLVLLVLGSFGLLYQMLRAQERLLEDGMETSAALLAGALNDDALFVLNVSLDRSTGATNLDTMGDYLDLQSARALGRVIADANARLAPFDVAVLSPDGRLLLDAQGFKTTDIVPPETPRDVPLVVAAAGGVASSSERSMRDRSKRVYHPLTITRDGTEVVVGILRLKSEPSFRFPVGRQMTRVLASALATLVLIGVVWWVINGLIRRTQAAERAMIQSERLRALGTATAGIAHELRNPLGILMLTTEEMRAELAEVPAGEGRARLERSLGDLEGELLRLRQLTDQFLSFAKAAPEAADRTPRTNLVEATAATVRLFQKGAPPNLAIEFTPTDGALMVPIGEWHLRQILLNLMTNAAQALDGRRDGRLSIKVMAERGQAVVAVADNGPGMDAATLAQVFDPFFTTRAEGTGLGLSLSRTLAEGAGGTLELASAPGQGTTARLAFPMPSLREDSRGLMRLAGGA